MAKKVLVVLSGHGYTGKERIGSPEALDGAPCAVGFVARQSDRVSSCNDPSSSFTNHLYGSAPMLVNELKHCDNKCDFAWADVAPYSALLPVDSNGPHIYMVNNQRVPNLNLGFAETVGGELWL